MVTGDAPFGVRSLRAAGRGVDAQIARRTDPTITDAHPKAWAARLVDECRTA